MVPVARRNLLAEKGRLAMSIAGVAFAVLLTLIVLSLYRGWSEVGQIITRLPGDVWVMQEGTSGLFGSTSMLPADAEDDVSAVPGVRLALPVYSREVEFEHDGDELRTFFMALDAQEGVPLAGDLRERFFPPPGGIVLDEVLADKAGLSRGDTLTVFGRELTVVEVSSGGNAVLTQFAFLNADDARAIFGTPGFVNFYLLALEESANVEAVVEAAGRAVPRAQAETTEEFAGSLSDQVDEGFLPVVGVLVGIGVIVGGAVIALTTYTATIEKSRDFSVLKALGASAGYLYRIVVTQSLIVGVAGSLVGIVVAAIAANLIREWIPEFITDLRAVDVAIVFGAAIVTAIAASWMPVRRINSIDPAMVFRA